MNAQAGEIPGVELIDVADIDPSPTNPRKTFDAGEVTELAEDLKLRGFLQFPIVRPAGDRYELVIGEKRWRAAREAGLGLIPCTVREMNDREVLEAQIVENAKRSDVAPLEEAEAYHSLIERHGYTAEDVAAKVGKSRALVYQRLQLRQLDTVARKLLGEGKLLASQAVLLARIPRGKKLQDEAAKILAGGRYGPGADPLSFRRSKEVIERQFMLRLAEAPWKLDDELLVVEAGSCKACPKRTGNQRDLFEDVSSPDVCTDPPCFADKRQAFAKRRAAELRNAGARVLKKAEAKEVIHRGWGSDPTPAVAYDAPYVELDERCRDDAKQRTYRQILKPADEDLVVAEVRGHVLEMVPKKGLAQKLKAAGVAKPVVPKAPGRMPARDDSYARQRRLEDEIERRVRTAIREYAAETWDGSGVPFPVLVHMAGSLLSMMYLDTDHAELLTARGITVAKRERAEMALLEWARVSPPRDVAVLIAELSLDVDGHVTKESPVESACRVYGIDHAGIAKTVRADAKKLEKKAAKKPAKKKAAKKKAAGRRAEK